MESICHLVGHSIDFSVHFWKYTFSAESIGYSIGLSVDILVIFWKFTFIALGHDRSLGFSRRPPIRHALYLGKGWGVRFGSPWGLYG